MAARTKTVKGPTGPQTLTLPAAADETLLLKVAEEALHGERGLWEGLSVHEQEILVQWLAEALVTAEPNNPVHDVLWELDFHRKPVAIDPFLESPEYMGKVAFGLGEGDAESQATGRGQGLHPRWREDLKEVFRPGSPYTEWIATGAIGIGKTSVAMLALAYKLYWLSCLRNPQAYYGLMGDSLMVFGIYSITKQQVADTGYYKLRGWIDSSPYFRSHFPRSRKIDSQIVFQRQNVRVVPGSRELHALGLDLFAFAIDEVNFMQSRMDRDRGKMVGQAYDLYNSTHSRITSRFLRPGGTIPGIMLLLSSKNAQTSFLEELLKQRREGGMARTYVSDYPLWEVKPAHRYILPKFRVEVGDRVAPSRLLPDENLDNLRQYHAGRLPLAAVQQRAKPPDKAGGSPSRAGAVVVSVPGEFLKVFEEDTDKALREVAAVSTFNVSPLVRDRASVPDAVRVDIPNPFTREAVTLSVSDELLIEDYFKIDVAARVVESSWIPRLNPTLPRFVHVDLGLTGDAAGFAMGHISGVKQVERLNPDGTRSAIESPFIIIDLMLRILPPPGSEIDFAKIRAFLGYLKRIYPIVKVTLDGWQSADFVQIVRKPPLRFEADIQSIDKTDGPYLSLRSAHFDRRIAMYGYPPYQDEVLDLQRIKRPNSPEWKVDHPEKATKGGKGSKDVSDAVAGVVWGLLSDARFGRGTPVVEPDVREAAGVSTRVVDPATPAAVSSRTRRVAGQDVNLDALRENLRKP